MNRVRLLLAGAAGVAAVVFLLAPATPAWAQGGQVGNSSQLEKDYGQIKGKFFNENTGKDQPDARVIDIAAQYFVYRVTWPQWDNRLPETVHEFSKQIDQILYNRDVAKASNEKFVDAFGQALTTRFRDLTTKVPLLENPKSLLHGAQMLPVAARLKHPSFGAYLVELIKVPDEGRPGHDAIRLWAIRGLREMFPVASWGEPAGQFDFSSKTNQARKKADLDMVETLTTFIQRKAPLNAPPDEIGAYLYLRREAIEALAAAGAPAVNAHGKSAAAEGEIAPVLLKVLMPGAMQPPATLNERNEAALGLCQIRPVEEYVPGPTVHFIGQALVDMIKEYAADQANIVLKKAERTQPTAQPWKIVAARWQIALQDLVKTTKNAQQARDLESRARLILKEMSKETQLDNNAVNTLETFVTSIRPQAGPIQLYKKIKGSAVEYQPGAGS